MKIFLAGATGVVGRLLLPMLVKAGHDIAGTTRSAAKATGTRAVYCGCYKTKTPDDFPPLK